MAVGSKVPAHRLSRLGSLASLAGRVAGGMLAEGARPERIVALTFTRKAAGEMRDRLDAELRRWLLAPLSAPPGGATISTDRTLCNCMNVSESAVCAGIVLEIQVGRDVERSRCPSECLLGERRLCHT